MEQVPIVNDLVPPGVVTDGLAPVLDTINGATGGVTQPVLKVVGPVTQVIDPVVDVVVSAPESIPPAPALPVPAIPVHAGPVIPPAVVDVLPGEVSASAVHVAAAAPVPVVTATQTVTSDADFSQPTRNLNTASAAQFLTFPQGSIKSAAVPVPAGLAQIGHDFGGLLTVPLTSAGGALSFMTGAGSAEPLTAVTAGTFLIFLMVKEPAHPSVTAGMPAGPSFDPGSSPD